MPLVELKTIQPRCDICGKVGATWTTVAAGDELKAVPEGWLHGFDVTLGYWGHPYLVPRQFLSDAPVLDVPLVCDTCVAKLPPPLINLDGRPNTSENETCRPQGLTPTPSPNKP